MPKDMERELMKSGKKKGFTGKRLNKYVYGTMNKMDMMESHKKGESMPMDEKKSKYIEMSRKMRKK